MPPGGEGGGEHGQGDPATVHGDGGRDGDDPFRSSPPPLPGFAVVSVESEEENKKKQKHEQAEVSFSEDVLIEILSRVPYRSLCRFKCVSKPWLAVCSYHDVRKRSPQTLSGFFFHSDYDFRTMSLQTPRDYFVLSLSCNFHNLSGKGAPLLDPDLPFLRSTYKYFRVQQCSTSLLLCKCWKSPHPMQYGWNSFPKGRAGLCQWFSWPEADQFDYVVCNPATQEWILLPPIELDDLSHIGKYSLCFDPAIPSRFTVFVPLLENYGLPVAMIYSSQTGGWTSIQGQWDDQCDDPRVLIQRSFGDSECIFLNGTMHFYTHFSIVTVDMEGSAWREIKMPPAMTKGYGKLFIGRSQGHLYAWRTNIRQLSIWVLDDHDSGQWTLKCTVNCLELFGRDRRNDDVFTMFAIHPECDLVFLTDSKKTLSYDMTNQRVHVISASGDFPGGLPYIPCFAEWKADAH